MNDSYKITCHFPPCPYDHSQYRLRFLETRLDEDGQLRSYHSDGQRGTFAPVAGWPDDFSWRTVLREDELPGNIELPLANRWQPLPALTHADQLRAIRCTPATDIQLARSKKTGQLLIKSQQSTAGQVMINFIIAPEQTYFTQLTPGESLILTEDLCSQRLQALLDENIFYPEADHCKAYKELRAINKIDEIPQRLSALMNWLDTFSDHKNVTGQDEQLLLNMLRKKQGVCRHKAMIFQMLCHYWGIPARQVSNASHVFVEISPDGGHTWRQYQLGGRGTSIDTTIDTTGRPDWKAYSQPHNSVLKPPVNRPGPGASDVRATAGNRVESELERIFRNFNFCVNPYFCKGYGYKTVEIKKEDLELLKTKIQEELQENDPGSNPFYHFLFLHPELPELNKLLLESNEWFELLTRLFDHYKIESYATGCARRDILVGIGDTSMKNKEAYISLLCDVCESSLNFKYFILGALQQHATALSDFPCKDRIQKMVNDAASCPLKIKACVDLTETMSEFDELDFLHFLPNSKYLEAKTSTVRIVRKYTSTAKENARLVPENLVNGLPAFLTQFTLKESKPVIFDLCYIGPEFEQRVNAFVTHHADENTEQYKLIKKTLGYEEHHEYDLNDAVIKVIHMLFFNWLAQHHLGNNKVWRWLIKDYKTCHEQSFPTQGPDMDTLLDFKCFDDCYVPVERSTEAIRTQLKEPTAVVLKEKDFLIMLDEFLTMI